jgi:protocatechuate 3,4-dioxygenase, alpha subunit
MTLAPTPGQTVGPFFGYALPFDGDSELVPPGTPGAIRLHGQVLDGAGQPVPDALIELWQVDTDGVVSREPGSLRRDGFTFTGWGRASTDNTGRYTFTTVAPGASVPGAAPFFAVTVFARGLLNRLFTRAYLPEDTRALDADPLLASLDRDRRETLVARPDQHGYAFDIRLQGVAETVFLSYPRHAD